VPVQKFRTFDDARRALWLPAGDPALLLRMKRLGELWRGPRRRHGVFRFRTIEEAKRRDDR
jgi:hypothetical protein